MKALFKTAFLLVFAVLFSFMSLGTALAQSPTATAVPLSTAKGIISAIGQTAVPPTVTIHPDKGSDVTLKIVASTRITKAGAGSLAGLAVNDYAQATYNSTTMEAVTIAVGPPPVRPIYLAGHIKSIEAQKGFVLTVKDKGDVSIKVNDDTKYRIPGEDKPKLNDLDAGDLVSVSLVETKDGNLALFVQLLPINLVGHIKSIEAQKGFILTVKDKGDVAIKVNADTKYRIPGQADAKLGDFKVGDRVSVSLWGTKDGNLAASVQLLPINLVGQIKGVEVGKGFVLTVKDRGDVGIKVSADTKYKIPGQAEAKLGDFKPGDQVSVSLIETKEGNLALSVQLLPISLTGVIKSIEAGKGFALTVKDKGDVAIKVSADTKYRIPGQPDAKLGDFKPGDRVSVSLIETKDGNLALSVQLLPITLIGEIKSIEAQKGFVLIVKDRGDVSIKVNDQTVYRIPGEDKPKLNDLDAGDRVTVSLLETKDGNLALSVQLLPSSLAGQIKSIEAGKGFILTVKDKGDVSIKVSAETKYRIPGQAEAKPEDFKAGDRVSVSLLETKAGNLALSVQLLPISLSGQIKSIEPQKGFVLTVMDKLDVAIKVNADTKYRVPGQAEAKLEDFKAGDRVSVSLLETKAGNLALSVQLLPVSLTGHIKSIEPQKGFVVSVMGRWDVSIKVNAETKYRIPGQAEAKLDDLKAGDRVSVSFTETKDGNLALSVQLLPYYLSGQIKSIEPQKSFVLTVMDRWDVSIKVNADTVYRIPDEHKDKLNDFKPGDRISVSLIETKDGNLAISVQLLKEQDEKPKDK